jgi:hypothetical protein
MDLDENVEIESPEKKFFNGKLARKKQSVQMFEENTIANVKRQKKKKTVFWTQPTHLNNFANGAFAHCLSTQRQNFECRSIFRAERSLQDTSLSRQVHQTLKKNKNEMWTPVQLSAPNPKKKPRRKCGHESN